MYSPPGLHRPPYLYKARARYLYTSKALLSSKSTPLATSRLLVQERIYYIARLQHFKVPAIHIQNHTKYDDWLCVSVCVFYTFEPVAPVAQLVTSKSSDIGTRRARYLYTSMALLSSKSTPLATSRLLVQEIIYYIARLQHFKVPAIHIQNHTTYDDWLCVCVCVFYTFEPVAPVAQLVTSKSSDVGTRIRISVHTRTAGIFPHKKIK